MKTLSIDIESYSETDLTKAGVYRYAVDPKFEILLFGYSVDGGPVEVVDLAQGEQIPEEILKALLDDSVIKSSFNAMFERICLSRFLWNIGMLVRGEYLSPRGWHCDMVWAGYMGFPMNLKNAGKALGLEEQKMTEGKELIRYFCVPCAPTKTNKGRTRNYPHHAPDKWMQFKKYNKRDVEVELSIADRLKAHPVPENVWQEYHLDQEINDRGIGIDAVMVANAIKIYDKAQKDVIEKLKVMTGLENPRSVVQMQSWLRSNGINLESLGQKELAKETISEPYKSVLNLWQQLAMSAVKKYQAMDAAVCPDGRLRGMFRFYGANRTGRFSGAIVQLQNLYRNSLPDLAQARELVKLGDYEALNALYDSVPEVLAECVRTAFIPQKGMKFIVADFSAIEARVVAYIAGEDWKIDAFREGKDIYCETASKMFHKTVVKHGENGELRQLGKVCELACIAFNSLVLTDKGLVPIQNVTKNMKLWDGEEWVSHDGVIYKGEREIITYDGLTATKDHLVYVDGQSNPTRFDIAATSGAHLVQTGDGRRTIRLGKNNQSRETMEQKLESLLCFNPMSRLRFSSMAAFRQFKKRKVKRMPILFKTEANSFIARPKTNCCQTTMYESQGRRIQKLRCKRDKVCFFKRNRSWSLLNSKFRITRQKDGDRPHRYKWRLCSWQYSVCRPQNKLCKSAQKCFKSIRAKILALCIQRSNEKIISRFDKRRNYRRSKERSISEAKKLENYTRTSKVYDILNAGKHHRFTVSGKLVHNCGYGGSVKALEAFGALENGMNKEDLQPLVNMWRTANSKIVRLWYDVDKAAKEAIKEKTIRKIHDLTFTYKGGMMYITLPSGRRLSYVKPQIGKNKFGSESIEYMGLNIAKQWSKLETFGGKLVENITQAISRDILCHAMFMLKDYRICAHVHDEIIAECPIETSVEEVCEKMATTPKWCKDLPLKADGYECKFYRKD